VICLDHCGFADLVTNECGIKVYPGSADEITSGLIAALCTLYQDEPLRRRLAQGAIRRSRDYSWHGKMASLSQVYNLALQSQSRSTREDPISITPSGTTAI